MDTFNFQEHRAVGGMYAWEYGAAVLSPPLVQEQEKQQQEQQQQQQQQQHGYRRIRAAGLEAEEQQQVHRQRLRRRGSRRLAEAKGVAVFVLFLLSLAACKKAIPWYLGSQHARLVKAAAAQPQQQQQERQEQQQQQEQQHQQQDQQQQQEQQEQQEQQQQLEQLKRTLLMETALLTEMQQQQQQQQKQQEQPHAVQRMHAVAREGEGRQQQQPSRFPSPERSPVNSEEQEETGKGPGSPFRGKAEESPKRDTDNSRSPREQGRQVRPQFPPAVVALVAVAPADAAGGEAT
ncbi:hypothetical protein Esti_005381 [Eimeria stiedai]